MRFWEILLLALGVAMDAFAVSVCLGLRLKKSVKLSALVVGLYFGFFQAVMPLIGYYVATLFADKIIAFDHWIAFGLLLLLGGRMVVGSFQKEPGPRADKPDTNGENPPPDEKPVSLKPQSMLPYALATSIDALAVGVSFAFLKVKIIPAVSLIGAVTLCLSAAGVKIGSMFGTKLKSKAELAGGVVLILIGIKILIEHLLLP